MQVRVAVFFWGCVLASVEFQELIRWLLLIPQIFPKQLGKSESCLQVI